MVVTVLLAAVCLGLAFRGGAYSPGDWLPFLIGVAALAVVLAASAPALRFTRLQWVALALFAAQALWTAVSIFWATSRANAWEETNRTLLFAVGMVLVCAAVHWSGSFGLKILAALSTAAVAVVGLVIAVRLGVSDDPSAYFLGGRLNYPVTYFNGLACLLMMGFWLALGMANGPLVAGKSGPGSRPRWSSGFPRWAQPILLALAVFLLALALLPQSRGGLWTFFLVIPFFVIFSPNRFRALLDLGIVALPMVLFWDRLNGVYVAISDGDPLGAALDGALGAIGYSVLIVLAAWAISWLVERLTGPLARRVRLGIGIALVVIAVGGAAAGLVYADHRTGDLGGYLGDRWGEFVDDTYSGSGASRFTAVGLNGRLRMWKIAGEAFKSEPILGLGAQNYELYFYEQRADPIDVRQPHSQPMQLLAELGVPGLVLWIAFVVLALVRAAVLRFRRARTRVDQAVLAAMITAVLAWFIHSSADWIWQLAAVSLPAMMLLGGLVGAGGSATPQPAASRPAWRRWTTRPVLAVLALAVLVSAALPYLSLRYCDMAAGARDVETMLARTNTAAALDPTSVQPFAVRANAYKTTAAQAPEDSPVRVEQYRLAAEAWVDATEREPSGWLYHFKAGEMFLAARDAAVASGAATANELQQAARTSLDEARGLNPLSRQIDALEKSF